MTVRDVYHATERAHLERIRHAMMVHGPRSDAAARERKKLQQFKLCCLYAGRKQK